MTRPRHPNRRHLTSRKTRHHRRLTSVLHLREASEHGLTLCRDSSADSITIPCSSLAGLVGLNPYQSIACSWRQILKSNFKKEYNRLTQEDPSFLTPEDAAAREKSRLSKKSRQALYRLAQGAIEAPAGTRVDARKIVPNITAATAKQIKSDVMMQRGVRAEAAGLALAESADKKVAKDTREQILALQRAADEEARQVTERLAAAHSRQDADKIQAESDQRRNDICNAIKVLSQRASQQEAPIVRGHKLFRSDISPGIAITGRIDGQRIVEDEVHIVEHKARQSKLFMTLREYEKIQCLGYMHLVRHENHQCSVRCFLIETFKEESWRCEVVEDAELWEEGVLEVLKRRAQEFQDLMQQGARTDAALSWFEALPCSKLKR